jgi:hypothetical protein
VSLSHLERAVYHLSTGGALVERPEEPAAALAELRELSDSPVMAKLPAFHLRLELEPHEAELIERGDVAGMYRYGVHPNLVRNFAGMFRIDYVARYREAGL